MDGFQAALRNLQIIERKMQENPIGRLPDGRIVQRGAHGEWEQIGTSNAADDWAERKELLLYERSIIEEMFPGDGNSPGLTGALHADSALRADGSAGGDCSRCYFPKGARLLVVGDGDLSWSTSLIRGGHVPDAANLTCTVLERSEKKFLEQYREDDVQENLDILIGSGARLLFDVDATSTQLDLYGRCCTQLFNVVVWNFPYVSDTAQATEQGTYNSADRDSHTQTIVGNFLKSARANLAANGEIWIGLVGKQLERWGVTQAASDHGLVPKGSLEFHQEDFPGYCTRFGDHRDRDPKRKARYLKGRSSAGAPRYHIFVLSADAEPAKKLAATDALEVLGKKKKKGKTKKMKDETATGVNHSRPVASLSSSIIGEVREGRWSPMDVTVKMVCPDGEGMRGDLFGATFWGMEDLGMLIEHIYPGEPLHMSIAEDIPRPYEILPSGRILFCPAGSVKSGRGDLLFLKVLDVDGSGDDINALNDAISRYKDSIMAEDRISKYPTVLRRNAGLQLEVKLCICPVTLGSLPEEAQELLSKAWSRELSHPLECARLHPRWHLDQHPVPDCFRVTRE